MSKHGFLTWDLWNQGLPNFNTCFLIPHVVQWIKSICNESFSVEEVFQNLYYMFNSYTPHPVSTPHHCWGSNSH